MRELIPQIDAWQAAGKSVGLATVVQTWGSSPRAVGSRMAFTSEGEMVGSVSGGCVEGAVLQSGIRVLESSQSELLHFGVNDETAWDVGLACGGEIEIIVAPLDPSIYKSLRSALLDNLALVEAIVITGAKTIIGRSVLITPERDIISEVDETPVDELIALGMESLERQRSGISDLTPIDKGTAPQSFFLLPHLPPPQLILVGGVHISIALAHIAKLLGYRVTLIDPRRAFGSDARFPHVDRLIQAWPEEAFEQIPLSRTSAVAALTHDPKIDDPALEIALRSEAFYIGALGSRKTQTARRERLLERGLTDEQIARLRGPIGLDIGARSPEEIALAIIAEILQIRSGLAV